MGAKRRALQVLGPLAFLTSALTTAGARADTPQLTPYVDRGRMLGAGQGFLTMSASAGSTLDASMGGGIGITDRVSLEGSFGTLALSPRARYHSPQAGLWLGIVDTPPFELDATTHVTFGLVGEEFIKTFEPGAQAVFRMGHALRFDLGAYLPMTPNGRVGLRIPAALAAQLNNWIHASVSTGISFEDMHDAHRTASIPLGITLGCSVPLARGGYLVVAPSLAWSGIPARSGPLPTTLGASVTFVSP